MASVPYEPGEDADGSEEPDPRGAASSRDRARIQRFVRRGGTTVSESAGGQGRCDASRERPVDLEGTPATLGPGDSWSIEFPGVSVGKYEAIAKAVDLANNEKTKSVKFEVV